MLPESARALQAWPDTDELSVTGDTRVLEETAAVLRDIRKAKSEAKVSMRAGVTAITITGPTDALARLALTVPDLRAAGRFADYSTRDGESVGAVDIEVSRD